jgi:hypothetical protein
MGQCLSAPPPPGDGKQGKQTQRAAQYLEDGANRSIVEGLSQAYKVNKLLGSGKRLDFRGDVQRSQRQGLGCSQVDTGVYAAKA